MASIFLSYRRGPGASEAAGRLHDRLASRYGEQNVFMDVDKLRPGTDFVDAISRAIGSSTVVLAVIDPQWAVDASGRNRIAEAGDYVRLEIGNALQRGVTVIPVLVLGAEIPPRDQLPPDLQPLAARQAVVLSHERFSTDILPLEVALNDLLSAPKGPEAGETAIPRTVPPKRTSYPEPSKATTILVLAVLGLALCGILSPFAWSMGRKELKAVDAGRRDPSSRGIANVGRILGIIGTLLLLLGVATIVAALGVGATV